MESARFAPRAPRLVLFFQYFFLVVSGNLTHRILVQILLQQLCERETVCRDEALNVWADVGACLVVELALWV
jgi:hypothetical protein